MVSEKSASLVISYLEYDLIRVNVRMYLQFFSVTVAKVSYRGLINEVLSYRGILTLLNP